MYSSSEDSDSDSGANFKRGKRKIKAESPVREARKETYRRKSPEKGPSRLRREDEDRYKRHEARRRDDDSRAHKTENGDKNVRKSPKHERVISKERPKEATARAKSRERSDKHDSRKHRSKSSERRTEEVKKKRSRSADRDNHHQHRGTSQADRKDPKDYNRNADVAKKAKELPKYSESFRMDPKHHQRSKSPLKHSKDDSHHRHHSSSRKESSQRRSQSRHEEKGGKSVEVKKPSRHSSQDDAAYGPALPPPAGKRSDDDGNKQALLRAPKRKSNSPISFKPKIGPSLPKDFHIATDTRVENYDIISSDEDDNTIGPLPASAEMSERDLELEKRKIEIKLQQLDRRMMAVTNNSDVKHREEWMLELPEIRKVPDMGLSSRQFRKNDRPDFSDRSNWTKTPNDQHKKSQPDKKSDEDRRRELEVRRRDEQQEKLAKEHKKSHKRDKSLLEIHEKKLKKDKKNQKDEKPERRPFNRDNDLSVNKFDEARKKSALKKAQLLDTRFSSGNKKYL